MPPTFSSSFEVSARPALIAASSSALVGSRALKRTSWPGVAGRLALPWPSPSRAACAWPAAPWLLLARQLLQLLSPHRSMPERSQVTGSFDRISNTETWSGESQPDDTALP